MLVELEDRAAEDVRGQALLSVALLASLLPMEGRQLEDALGRPGRQQAQQIAEVGRRLDRASVDTSNPASGRRVKTGQSMASWT